MAVPAHSAGPLVWLVVRTAHIRCECSNKRPNCPIASAFRRKKNNTIEMTAPFEYPLERTILELSRGFKLNSNSNPNDDNASHDLFIIIV